MNEQFCSQLVKQKFMENILYKCYDGCQNELTKTPLLQWFAIYKIIELLKGPI